ncbi:YheC/YheD family protein [Neobacillus muris]|uniref:YheC/YheD family endospore coat-associated protein n=1 Tax=Neobacillus muris TaxID=2941334 RepID=UPI00203E777D|nr:YheC/YheD family protein [Neobacillus muris]
MRERYHIEVVQNDQLIAFCPPSLLKEQQLKRMAFGSLSMEIEFLPHPDKQDRIVLSREIQKGLKFPDSQQALHAFIENETLYIGPLVGIFTAGFMDDPANPIGERTEFFKKLLSVNKTVGALPFLFGDHDINWEQGTIDGYFYQQHSWHRQEVPFPNVIYDRLPNRKIERSPRLIKIKQRLQKEYLIPWFNPGFFNKLDIYDRLQQDDSVDGYLPETHPFTSFSLIETMLAKYGHVYIKPKNGSLGLGVHQILYDKHSTDYFCRYQDQEGMNRLRKFPSLELLFKWVFPNQTLENMLVQQGIHLLRINRRPVDFRIHTNKDDLGSWHVSAIAAKVAGHGSVTTHKRSGGEVKTLNEIFTKEEAELYTKKLSDAALQLSKVLEQNVEGIIGEIGFDLGIDRHGDVWLFEANSKPGRSIFSHPKLKPFDFETHKLSLAFSIFLTEQALLHPEELYK